MQTERSDREPDAAVPLVSVIVSTYNHERSIAAALRSVLGQQFAAPVEILVAEDWSTDRTQEILASLGAEFPDRFRVLSRGRNLGLSQNLEDAFRQCRGRYISILEGDDEWIDPLKLERVVSALEAHPAWSGCFHSCRMETEGVARPDEILPHPPPPAEVALEDLLRRNYVPTYSTVTYRRGVVAEFPPWHRRVSNGDWGLHMLHAAEGPLGFLPPAMTAYRVHGGGLWSGKPVTERWFEALTIWAAIDAHFAWKYSAQIAAARAEYLGEISREYADLKRIEQRYHALGLDRVAGLLQPVTRFVKDTLGRKPDPK